MNEKKFDKKAEVYEKARPGYPREAICYIEQFLSKDCIMVDIGSGTGKLVSEFIDKEYTIYAVEPNAEMRHIAELNFAQGAKAGLFAYHSIDGTAENTTLPNSFADFITVAQALHWFDIQKFKQECNRILKLDGKVFVIYNKFSGKFAAEYAKFLYAHCSNFNGFGGGASEEKIKQFFDEGYICKSFTTQIAYDSQKFIDRALSSSYTPKAGEPDYNDFIKNLQEFFDTHQKDGKVIFENITSIYHF